MLLLVEEGPHAEAVRYVHLLSPQPVSALGAANVHRPSLRTISNTLHEMCVLTYVLYSEMCANAHRVGQTGAAPSFARLLTGVPS